MAVYIPITKCPLCNNQITNQKDAISFSPFVPNELDPLIIFSDGVFHKGCFDIHPLSVNAMRRYTEMKEKTTYPHQCLICKRTIDTPDEYFTFGHLTENKEHPLYQYNYAKFHRSCLANWSHLSEVVFLLENFLYSGLWKGKSLDWVISELKKLG